MSQILCHRSAKSFFTGVGEKSLPGAIQIWRMIDNTNQMERVNEVQAHSKEVSRLRLTHDNSNLFSVGDDGLVCIFDVKDRNITRAPLE